MKYQIIRLIDRPEMKEQMAKWFSEKWSVPLQAYLDSMEDCLSRTKPIPQWYVAVEDSRIIGDLGVIENDFHNRKDLTPNVCAVYTEPDRRSQGIAGALLRYVCDDIKAKGIDALYLVTDHVLCRFHRRKFVLISNFLEGVRPEFGTFHTVAIGAETDVGAYDLTLTVGKFI